MLRLKQKEGKYLEQGMISTITFLDPKPFKVDLKNLYTKIYCNSMKTKKKGK